MKKRFCMRERRSPSKKRRQYDTQKKARCQLKRVRKKSDSKSERRSKDIRIALAAAYDGLSNESKILRRASIFFIVRARRTKPVLHNTFTYHRETVQTIHRCCCMERFGETERWRLSMSDFLGRRPPDVDGPPRTWYLRSETCVRLPASGPPFACVPVYEDLS